MAQGPTGSEPRFSDDGHWYWNGSAWIPASQAPAPPPQAAPMPPQPALPAQPLPAYSVPPTGAAAVAMQRPKSHTGRNIAIGCGGLIALLVLVSICSSLTKLGSNSLTPTNAVSSPSQQSQAQASHAAASPSASPTPKASPTPSPSPKPTILLDFQGSGIKNSKPFNAPDHWVLLYSYDCTSFGFQGNFQVYLYQGADLVDILVNELGTKASTSTDVYQGGDGLHLEMNSECKWHVIATTG